DGDDRAGPGEAGARDGRSTHTPTADHGDRVTAGDAAGVDRRAQAGHHATAEQAGSGRTGSRVDLGALTGSDQGLLDERTDPQGWGEVGPVLEGQLLGRIGGVEAAPRAAALAGPTLATDGTPVEDDIVAGGDLGDPVTDGFDNAGGFVTEQVREVVTDPTLDIVQVGVANAAGLDRDHGLTRTRVRNMDGGHLDRGVLGAGDHALDALTGLTHEFSFTGPTGQRQTTLATP